MELLPIQVQSYSGGRSEEAPRRFELDGILTEVEEILDRWYQVENAPGWPRAEYFRVSGPDQLKFLLKHDLEADEWFLVSS